MALLTGLLPNEARAFVDPLPAFNFTITLVDRSSPGATAASLVSAAISVLITASFSECSGLEGAMQPYDHREGGSNDAVLRFPERTTWTNIRLRRGVTISDDLWNWYYGFVEGNGRRRDGVIALQNDLHIPVKVWHFRKGLPTRWAGPTFNAGESRLAFEEIEIAHEGVQVFGASAGISQLTGFSL